MPFSALDEDIIPLILAFCDVRRVLRIGRTCKLLRAVSRKRTVWQALLEDLAFRCVLHALPEDILHNATTDYLYNEVKRAVCGPDTWLPDSFRPPTVLRTSIFTFPQVPSSLQFVRLLPGGRYFVLMRDHFLEIWSIRGSHCVWSRDITFSRGGDLDMQEGGREIVLLMCMTPQTDVLGWDWVLSKFNLENEDEEILFTHPPFGFEPLGLPMVSGNLIAVAIRTSNPVLLLIDWRFRKYAAFEATTEMMFATLRFYLTPFHLVLVHNSPTPPHGLAVTVYCVSSLPSSCWFPLDDLTMQRVCFSVAVPLVSKTLSVGGQPVVNAEEVSLGFYQSPLVQGEQIGKLYVSQTETLPPSFWRTILNRISRRRTTFHPKTTHRATAFTFVLSPPNPTSSAGGFRIISMLAAVSRLADVAMSLAGYIGLQTASDLSEPGVVVDVQLKRQGVKRKKREVPIQSGTSRDNWNIASIAQTSAAIVWHRDAKLKVVYYR